MGELGRINELLKDVLINGGKGKRVVECIDK